MPGRFPRRSLLFASLAAACGAAGFGWLRRPRNRTKSELNRGNSPYRVSGGSMCPTLWGEHHLVRCPTCQIEFKIDASPTSGLAASDAASLTCWHCASPYPRPRTPPRSGDWVQLGSPPRSEEAYAVGQLVGIEHAGSQHIKRIFGIPGDRISLADTHVPGQLLRNDEPLAIVAPTLPVDRDALRELSRWKPTTTQDVGHRLFSRMERSWRVSLEPQQSASLVYHHANVYRGNVASPILDDDPANPIETRRLELISHIDVSLRVQTSSDVTIECWIQTAEGTPTRMIAEVFGPGDHAHTFSNSSTSFETHPDDRASSVIPITPKQPVVLVVRSDHAPADVALSQLAIDRGIEYRLGRLHERDDYPIHLATNEYYVVGDNVPHSVDSRTFGVITADKILGPVTRLELIEANASQEINLPRTVE